MSKVLSAGAVRSGLRAITESTSIEGSAPESAARRAAAIAAQGLVILDRDPADRTCLKNARSYLYLAQGIR